MENLTPDQVLQDLLDSLPAGNHEFGIPEYTIDSFPKSLQGKVIIVAASGQRFTISVTEEK